MITAEDTYDVADKILELPVHLIHQADDNVRTELGDLDGLAASIREVGVLQAITVIPAGDQFTILMGARRHAAAQVAGLMTIPAVIRTAPLAEKRRMTMLIENVQRHDLSPLDEAHAYRELEQDYDLSQADIARRVGCSQSHVSKRVSLLALPKAAQTMVADGDLNIGDALELTRIAEHPDHVAAAIERITGDFGWDAERAVERELDTIKVDEALAAAKAKLDTKGIRILHTQDGYGMNAKERAARERALAGATLIVRTDNSDGFPGQKTIAFEKPAKHASEPCHAVTLLHQSGKVTETGYCTETKRHTAKGASPVKAVKPAPRAKAVDDAVAHERKLEAEATAAREKFIVEVVRNHKLDRATIVAQVLRDYAMSGWQYNERCKTLGIDTLGRDGQIALRDYLAGGTDNVLRACLAVLFDDADASDPIVEGPDPLAQYGYEPTEWELTQRSSSTRLDDEIVVDTIDPTLEHTPDNDDTNPDAVLCAYPGCELDDEHDSDHQPGVNDVTAPAQPDADHQAPDTASTAPEAEGAVTHPHLPDYIKEPKDRGNVEAKAGTRAEMCMHRWPDSPTVVSIQQELYRGVDEERAAELLAACASLLDQPLTEYEHDPINGGETTCRKLIERADPTNPRVVEIQQQLYRGRISIADAGVLRRELKKLIEA